MKVIIDRFEGDFALVETEDQQLKNMPRDLLPADAQEGSVISIEIDIESTKARREKIARLTKNIWID